MFNVIISSSVLVIFVIIIRALFRGKVSNCLVYSLWLLVVARLILPVPELIIQSITGWSSSEITSPVSIVNITGRIEKSIPQSISFFNLQNNVAANVSNDTITSTDYILHGLWFVGFVAIITVQIISEKKLRRRLLESREQIDAVQKVYMTNSIDTPVLFRSRGITLDIYIPVKVALDSDILKYAIKHENVHRKHGDIWWSYLRNILVAVYWFNPFVWTAAVLSKRDAEYACDSGVMKTMDKRERIAYGNSLLSLVQPMGIQDIFYTTASMNIIKREMEERIIMIRKGIKNSITSTAAVCVAAALAATIAFTGAKADGMVQKTVVQSKIQTKWTDEEVKKAEKAVQKYVKKRNSKNKYKYYNIKNIYYNKEYSSRVLLSEKYSKKDKMIVLLSEISIYYKTDSTGKTLMIDGDEYPNWMWILKQNDNGNWKVEENMNSQYFKLSFL